MRQGRALRQLTLGTGGNSAGRNSAGRITIFHRGGGVKRLQRKVDLKRSNTSSSSSIGIVERIEYDPNRSSRIALVRWIEGVRHQRKCNSNAIGEQFTPHSPPPRKIIEPTPATIRGLFSFASLPSRNVDQRKVACFSPGLMAALVIGAESPSFTSKGVGTTGRKLTCAKDVFLSADSLPSAKGETETGNASSFSLRSSRPLPRILVAGAKPAFFATRTREEVGGKNTSSPCEVRKWGKNNSVWTHRIKRKAAVSWHSFKDTLGFVGESKSKTEQGSLPANAKPKNGAGKADHAPVTYIIASHQLEPGKMVMNCKPS